MRQLAAGAALVGLVACTSNQQGGKVVAGETQAELTAVKEASMGSPSVHIADMTGPKREGITVSAEWSFEIQEDWQAYKHGVTAALKAKGYQATTVEADLLAFSKNVPGDLYSVRIRKDSASSRLRLSATFSASPD